MVGIRFDIDEAAKYLSYACMVARNIGRHDLAAIIEDTHTDVVDLAHIAGMNLHSRTIVPPLRWRQRESVSA